MQITPYFPRPPLNKYVELIWMLQGKPSYQREKVLPNAALELIINLGSYHKVVDCNDYNKFEIYQDFWIAGMQEKHIVIEALSESNLIGIRFRCGAAYHFLRMPVSELTNQVVEADQILGKLPITLREQLLETENPQQRLNIIESVLVKHIGEQKSDLLIDNVINTIKQMPSHSITKISHEVGISEKHLISLFKRYVGITPKLLERIFRFQSVINLVQNQTQVNWTEVAYQCGYYDQAHMIKEFNYFSGSTPSTYLKLRDEDHNHVIIG